MLLFSRAQLLRHVPRATACARPPQRGLAFVNRAAEWLTRRPSAETLRFLESKANEYPLDAPAQLLFCSAMYNSGLAREVLARTESGRFAIDDGLVELYVKSLVATYRIPESSAAAAAARVRAVVREAARGRSGALIRPDLLAAAALGVAPASASSSFSGAAVAAGAAAGSATNTTAGSATNPLIVELAPAKATLMDRFVVFRNLISAAVVLAIGYSLVTSKMPHPLSSLSMDIAEEVSDVPTTRFSDVKGVDESKQELQDVVAFLRDPERFKRLGAKVPTGVLLTGPPGTGKTLLARAVAGEAGCKFYAKSASEFEEMLVGLGAKRVRTLFAAARKEAPAIIFIDEIDAMGSKRGTSPMGSGSERQTLNQLLSCMDGFTKNEGVIVIGATNSPGTLDPALVRPGRFDTTVDVPLPDVKGRREIIELYLSRIVAAPDIDVDLLAKATPGFSGAQLEALVNSAALMAAQRDADVVEWGDLEEGRDKIIMGPAKLSRVRTPEMNRLVAYHEGGHTLTSMLTRGASKLHKVTILPRGSSGGATFSLPDDQGLATRESYLATIDTCMGGRVAEELIFGADKITDGAASDMQQATALARRFVTNFSMSEVGLSFFSGDKRDWQASPDRHAAIDAEVEKILRASYERVKTMLVDHRRDLERLAQALLEHETLTAEECVMAVDGVEIPRSASPAKQQLAQPKRQRAREPSLAKSKSNTRKSSGATASAASAAEKPERVWTFQRTWTFGGSGPKAPPPPTQALPKPTLPSPQAEASPPE